MAIAREQRLHMVTVSKITHGAETRAYVESDEPKIKLTETSHRASNAISPAECSVFSPHTLEPYNPADRYRRVFYTS